MKIIASVPAYNSASTIKDTIMSLANQSYPFYQIRVYDNKSTDHTVELIKSLIKDIPNLSLIQNEINIGAEKNFTRCISEASEDLCLIAHADDIYHPDFVKNVVDVFSKSSDVVATFCAANEINSAGAVIGKRFNPKEILNYDVSILEKKQAIRLFYKYGNFVTCPSVVARSSVFREKIKIWNGETYTTSADLDVWMRLLDFGKIAFLNKYLINYRVAEASYSYRIAKIRTNKHDIFKVLESSSNKIYADKYRNYLNFLLNKDFANRFLNTLRTKDKETIVSYSWDVEFNFFDILKVGLNSFWHLKMMTAIFGLRFLYSMKRFL